MLKTGVKNPHFIGLMLAMHSRFKIDSQPARTKILCIYLKLQRYSLLLFFNMNGINAVEFPEKFFLPFV